MHAESIVGVSERASVCSSSLQALCQSVLIGTQAAYLDSLSWDEAEHSKTDDKDTIGTQTTNSTRTRRRASSDCMSTDLGGYPILFES